MQSDHPKPYRSTLWPHVDHIRRMVAEGVTWKEIQLTLNREHGIIVTPATCCNFFQRTLRRSKPLPGVLKPRKLVNPLLIRKTSEPTPPLEIID